VLDDVVSGRPINVFRWLWCRRIGLPVWTILKVFHAHVVPSR
jgi:hypothetical protein